jgi:hypothetical protein
MSKRLDYAKFQSGCEMEHVVIEELHSFDDVLEDDRFVDEFDDNFE